jgi:hypothetical protein
MEAYCYHLSKVTLASASGIMPQRMINGLQIDKHDKELEYHMAMGWGPYLYTLKEESRSKCTQAITGKSATRRFARAISKSRECKEHMRDCEAFFRWNEMAWRRNISERRFTCEIAMNMVIEKFQTDDNVYDSLHYSNASSHR